MSRNKFIKLSFSFSPVSEVPVQKYRSSFISKSACTVQVWPILSGPFQTKQINELGGCIAFHNTFFSALKISHIKYISIWIPHSEEQIAVKNSHLEDDYLVQGRLVVSVVYLIIPRVSKPWYKGWAQWKNHYFSWQPCISIIEEKRNEKI